MFFVMNYTLYTRMFNGLALLDRILHLDSVINGATTKHKSYVQKSVAPQRRH